MMSIQRQSVLLKPTLNKSTNFNSIFDRYTPFSTQSYKYNAKPTPPKPQYVNIDTLPLTPNKQHSTFLTPESINTDYYPISATEYITYVVLSIGSLLIGASLVHNIFKPNLTIDLNEYESKLKANTDKPNNTITAIK